jgi:hypothetical protein
VGLSDEIARDLQTIEADLPGNTFSYTPLGGEAISGPFIPTMLHAGEQLLVGGKLVTVRRTAFIRADLLTTAPAARRPITLNDIEYRIAEVRLTAPESHYEIPVVDLSEL